MFEVDVELSMVGVGWQSLALKCSSESCSSMATLGMIVCSMEVFFVVLCCIEVYCDECWR